MGYLESLVRRSLSRLDESRRLSLAAACMSFNSELCVGTFCSGSDSPLLVFDAIARVLQVDCNSSVKIASKFSCERNVQKQRFIQHVFPGTPLIFKDAPQLGRRTTYDAIGDRAAEVPSVHCLIGGFPCTDASSLNLKAATSARATCVMNGDLSTGSCFHGVREYARRHRDTLQIIILENVPGLLRQSDVGMSNADMVVEFLREEGYFVKVWMMCPRLFGAPQRRRRLWFLAIKRTLLADTGLTEDQAEVILVNTMNTFVGSQPQEVDQYLFDEEDPLVRRYFAECNALRLASAGSDMDVNELTRMNWGLFAALDSSKRARAKKTTAVAWGPKHWKHFMDNELDWFAASGPEADLEQYFPGLQVVHPREYEILYLQGIRSFPDLPTRVIETSQSLQRGSGETSPVCCPTMTPSGRKYVSSRCRFLLGAEQLRLQNVWLDPEVLSCFPNKLLADLAGNAFETSCCCAVVCAAFALLSHKPEFLPSVPRPPKRPADDDQGRPTAMQELSLVWRRPTGGLPANNSRPRRSQGFVHLVV